MNKLNDWNKGNPCGSNWTRVWCYDNVGDEGYFHVCEFFTERYLMTVNLWETLAPEVGRLSQLEILYSDAILWWWKLILAMCASLLGVAELISRKISLLLPLSCWRTQHSFLSYRRWKCYSYLKCSWLSKFFRGHR
ncbi:hypothetical protein PIB30_058946 [Stylosanthes scabra]|uniref:Uncharacterized protein n=1 Tax=Stylosanthes scabra TaxID=79078 RepID=A0ABU6YLZ2_9FABA|nr:hypothetical protein [Stylosanthes scabra]